jgi:hypothetical protein
MKSNPLSSLLDPRYPPAAIGLDGGFATVVSLEKRRTGYVLRSAALLPLSGTLLKPSFDEKNISDPRQLSNLLMQVVNSAGLGRRKKWSVAVPEAATKSSVLTLENTPGSESELNEMIQWKAERAFGSPPEQLRLSHDRLSADNTGRARYYVTAVKESVITEYEAVFESLGWHAGLMLPRHIGEEQWLLDQAPDSDALLISSHNQGFTATIVREGEPIMSRGVICVDEERADELFRLLLYYRDRLVGSEGNANSLDRLLVMGEGFKKSEVVTMVNDTLGTRLRALHADDLGISLPSAELSFDIIAAPAGLASLAWR